MKQETTWLVLGQEWRDLSLLLFGMAMGGLLGFIFTYDHLQRKGKLK